RGSKGGVGGEVVGRIAVQLVIAFPVGNTKDFAGSAVGFVDPIGQIGVFLEHPLAICLDGVKHRIEIAFVRVLIGTGIARLACVIGIGVAPNGEKNGP